MNDMDCFGKYLGTAGCMACTERVPCSQAFYETMDESQLTIRAPIMMTYFPVGPANGINVGTQLRKR